MASVTLEFAVPEFTMLEFTLLEFTVYSTPVTPPVAPSRRFVYNTKMPGMRLCPTLSPGRDPVSVSTGLPPSHKLNPVSLGVTRCTAHMQRGSQRTTCTRNSSLCTRRARRRRVSDFSSTRSAGDQRRA